MSDLVKKSAGLEQEVMPSFDFLLDEGTQSQSRLAEHRIWLKNIKHERPLPKDYFKV